MKEEEIFHKALEQPLKLRVRYLDEACGDDAALRKRVELLLQANANPGSFLGQPAAAVATIDMSAVSEKPGTQIGPYKLREQIGEGGFGVVYVAEQSKPVRRKVALKIIKPGMDTKDVIARFEAERQALALMEHPNIAQVLDAGATDSGRPYFVMELVRGVPITEFCDEQKLSTRKRLQLFVDICRAVQHAHQKGIIHRDLKPSNILVTLDDNRPIPKVIDFGIAKALSRQLTDNSIYTAYGQMIGTPLYMAPEQAQLNLRDVDTRSDVYSLGVLLYELLTGTTPFDKETLQKSGFDEMRRIICEVEPPRPSARISTLNAEALSTVSDKRKVDSRKLSKSLRGELDWIVMKALEKDRNRRYESASAFAADLARYLADEPVLACPPSVWYRFGKFARRKKATLAFASLIVLFVVTLGSGAGWVVRDRKARKDAAERERLALEEKSIREREDRRKQLADRVEFVLDAVAKYKKAQNWIAARQANSRAKTLLQGSDGYPKLKERIQRHEKELDFVAQLRAVREKRHVLATLDGIRRQARRNNAAYAGLFRTFGIDIEKLSPEQAAAKLKSHPDILPSVATILDDWASSETETLKNRKQAAKLWHLAIAIDSDRWRNDLRKALIRGDDERLKTLAKSEDVLDQPPMSLWLLGANLGGFTREDKGIDRDMGVDLLRKAAQRYPHDFWLNATAGVLLSRLGRHKEAPVYFRAAHVLRPRVYGVQHELAGAWSRAGFPDQAIEQFKNLLRRHPKFWWPHYGIGAAYNKKGDYERALEHLQIALTGCRDRKRLPGIHQMLGVLYAKRKRPLKAIACFRKAIELDPKYAAAHGNLGLAYLRQKKLRRAIACFRKVIELDPLDPKAHLNLGSALARQRKLNEAVAAFRKAIEINPRFAKAYSGLGVALTQQKKLDEAVTAIRKSIEIDSTNGRAYYNLGNTFYVQRHYDESIAAYRKSIEFDRKYFPAYYNLGLALRVQNRLHEAIAAFSKAVELNPRFARASTGLCSAHFELGTQLIDNGRASEGIPHLRAAVRINPQYLGYTWALAFQLVNCADPHLRKPAEGQKLASKLVAKSPRYSVGWQLLGWAKYRTGDWQGSIDALQKSMRLQKGGTGDARQWAVLAMAYHQLGRKELARKYYDDSVRWMKPGHVDQIGIARLVKEAARTLGVTRRLPVVAPRPKPERTTGAPARR